MANAARGEVTFKAGERTYVLRPTFEALCAIEDRLDAGIIEIAERIVGRRYGIREIAAILTAGAQAADKDVTEAEIGAAIAEVGLRRATELALVLLAGALSGGSEEKKDP